MCMKLSDRDKECLRRLASQYMEVATLPVQLEKIELWKALNRGEMQRPMVVIDQLPWNELEQGEEALVCQVEHPFWREVEQGMRRTLYKWEHFPVDMVLEPCISIPRADTLTGYGLEMEAEFIVHGENDTAPSRRHHVVLHGPEEVDKIKDRTVVPDPEGNACRMAEAEMLFGGIAPVRLSHGVDRNPNGFHLGAWDTLTSYMGVENIYVDFIDRPEFLHAAMRRITDAILAGIREANRLEMFDDMANTCHCSYIYTDELLPGFGAGKGSVSKNCWAFGLAQLFTAVSPAFMEEFEFPYISEMASEFGMVYYGCCDRLDDRLDMVKRIPNVRKVSCSPWSDREAFAEKIGPKLVMSNKPTPAYLAEDSLNEDIIRADLRRTYDAARRNHANVEFILKDISTVRMQPERLTRWAQIAMQTVSE